MQFHVKVIWQHSVFNANDTIHIMLVRILSEVCLNTCDVVASKQFSNLDATIKSMDLLLCLSGLWSSEEVNIGN